MFKMQHVSQLADAMFCLCPGPLNERPRSPPLRPEQTIPSLTNADRNLNLTTVSRLKRAFILDRVRHP